MKTHTPRTELEALEQEKQEWEQRVRESASTQVDCAGDFGDKGKSAEDIEECQRHTANMRLLIAIKEAEIELAKNGFTRRCRLCHQLIARARLKIVPTTDLCSKCAIRESAKMPAKIRGIPLPARSPANLPLAG